MAYSLDYRKRALDLLDEGYSMQSVSDILNVGVTSLKRWKKRRDKGQLAAEYSLSRGAYKIDEEKLKAYVQDNPDSHLTEIAQAIGSKRSTVHSALQRLGITRKKRRHNTVRGMKTNAEFTGKQ